jgi:hypothetical protein
MPSMIITVQITHQLLIYADDINILGKNINTIRKNTNSVTGYYGGWSRRQRKPRTHLCLAARLKDKIIIY